MLVGKNDDLTTQDLHGIIAAYLETAFRALDSGDPLLARAALWRVAQYLLDLNDA